MPRAKNEHREQVKKKWIKSGGTISIKELAQVADVSESTVRKWKAEDQWQSELNRKKPGGQPENKNAKGHGAPAKNKNAETHGAYSTVHLEDLPPDERKYIESITLDTKENMLRELQLLIAKENDLRKKIKALEGEKEDRLHTDNVVEVHEPKNERQMQSLQKRLEELTVQRENIIWEMESQEETGKRKLQSTLDKLEAEIEMARDKISDNDTAQTEFKIATKTVMKASPFDRAMKLEVELNKTHGRIIKLLDSIKSYELDCRRVELEEKKYTLLKQKASGVYEIDPLTGEVIDESPLSQG